MPEYFKKQGEVIFLVGCNYLPRHHSIRMWKDWNSAEIEKELAHIRKLGMNTIRTFLLTEDFTSRPGELNRKAMSKLKIFLELCNKHGIQVLLTLFVGHMCGQNFDIPWAKGKDFMTDHFVIQKSTEFVQRLVEECKDYDSVLGWILTNELPHWTGPTSWEVAQNWTKLMYTAIREVDENHYVGTGDGARAELVPNYDGFRVEKINNYVDYLAPHIYLYGEYEKGDNDDVRLSYRHSCRIKYVNLGKPVLLEEFGCPTTNTSEENQARLYRIVLFSALANSAAGCLNWCYSDFSTEDIEPFVYHPPQLRYGVTRTDGSEKPAAREIRRFANLVKQIDFEEYNFPKPKAAIFVPSFMYEDEPETRYDRLEYYRILEQCFLLTKMAHVEVNFVRDPNLLFEYKYKLIFLPCVPALKSPVWRKLLDYVQQGGVILETFSGRPEAGFKCHLFEELFGARHQLRYGKVEIPKGNNIVLNFQRNFFGISKEEIIQIPIAGSPEQMGFCPVDSMETEVIAKDTEGRATILSHSIGKGKTIFVGYPLEYYLLNKPESSLNNEYFRVYRGARKAAGIEATFDLNNPMLEMTWMKKKGKSEYLLFIINHSWKKQKDSIMVKERKMKKITDWEKKENTDTLVSLDPAQVKVLNLSLDSEKVI